MKSTRRRKAMDGCVKGGWSSWMHDPGGQSENCHPHGPTEPELCVLTCRHVAFLLPVTSPHVGWVHLHLPPQGVASAGGVTSCSGSAGCKVAHDLIPVLWPSKSAFHPPDLNLSFFLSCLTASFPYRPSSALDIFRKKMK